MKSLLTLLAALCLYTPSHGESGPVPTLINGTPVPAGTWAEVVRITSSGGACTATLVGPRVIATAAHCATTGDTVSFKYKGENYTAKMTRSPLFNNSTVQHDVCLGYVNKEIPDVKPMTVGDTASTGLDITVLGYGCINPGGTGGNDGILRIGDTKVVNFSGTDMVSRLSGGAALCYGDSGGPAFTKAGVKLLGINSKGNISDTSWYMRLDLPQSISFMKDFAQANSTTICGINSDCSGSTPPPPADPSCQLTANPSSVKQGEGLSLMLAAINATSADIDGTPVNVPNGEKRITPTSSGSSVATVKNAQGLSATCRADYTVMNNPPPPSTPSCVLTAIPKTVQVGQPVTLSLQSTNANYASIDGNSVSIPNGSIQVTRLQAADYSGAGFVRNATGASGNCFTDYKVEQGTAPPPAGEFTITPTHCGDNYFPETGVKSACLALVSKDSSFTDMKAPMVILINFIDGSQEVLMPLGKKALGGASTGQAKEEWTVFTNGLSKGLSYPVAASRKATYTKRLSGDVPLAIEGYTSKNSLFLVDKLDAFSIVSRLSNLEKPALH